MVTMIVKDGKGRDKDMVANKTIQGLLTTGNVARLLNIHVNTVRRWSKQGILRVYRVGPRGDRRFQLQEVYGLIAELKVKKINIILFNLLG